jgi:hypothetical protein
MIKNLITIQILFKSRINFKITIVKLKNKINYKITPIGINKMNNKILRKITHLIIS